MALGLLVHFHRRRRDPDSGHFLPPRDLPPIFAECKSKENAKRDWERCITHRVGDPGSHAWQGFAHQLDSTVPSPWDTAHHASACAVHGLHLWTGVSCPVDISECLGECVWRVDRHWWPQLYLPWYWLFPWNANLCPY